MLQRVLRRTLELLDSDEPGEQNAAFKAKRALGVAEKEVAEWREMAAKIYLPEAKDGVLEQFSGYFDLEDYQVSKYNEYGIPVVVELEHLKDPAHPDYVPTLTHYNEALVRMARGMRIIKQADTLLVFALAPEAFEEEIQRKTLLFYEPRTLHYSSLSPGVYALVAARLGEMALAEKHFHLALIMDLEDVKKESAKALHTPTQGEVYTILTSGFAGVFAGADGALEVRPHLPKGWKSIRFRMLWRRANLEFEVTPKKVKVRALSGEEPVRLRIGGKEFELAPGAEVEGKV